MAPGEGWRDHWRQNICVLDSAIEVRKGDRVALRTCHDDWRIWFQARLQSSPAHDDGAAPDTATACAHARTHINTHEPALPPPADAPAEMGLQRVLFGGHTLRLVADADRAAAFAHALEAAFRDNAAAGGGKVEGRGDAETAERGVLCLVLGDGHWLALACVEAGASRVVDVEATPQALKMAADAFAAAALRPASVRAWLGQVSPSTVHRILERTRKEEGGGDRTKAVKQGQEEAGEAEEAEAEDAEVEMLGLGAGKVDAVVGDPFFLEDPLDHRTI